ncbi:MAG: GNAT family N-acetyltransferase [Acidimicrobiales bacterium]
MTPAELPDPAERAFYVEEFAGSTIVAGIVAHDAEVLTSLARAAASLDEGAARFAVVVEADAAAVAGALGGDVARLAAPTLDDAGRIAPDEAARLWLALADARQVVVDAPAGATSEVAAAVAVATRATKLVLTDAAGGWGIPPRSFADIATHEDALRAQLADRQGGAVVEALARALHGGVANVNLCRPHDLDRELFTFDGAGTLFTSGGYVELSDLGVDDLPAVERLVAQGVAAGLLRPRSRAEVARLAATGLGARVVGSGHLAGLVSLETAPYEGLGVGEIASLSTVSRFSGAGAGALLVEGVVARAAARGLREVFAVTVSEAAAAFFARRGFAEVEPDAIPAAKWAGYDADRRRLARAFVRSVTDGEQGTLGF